MFEGHRTCQAPPASRSDLIRVSESPHFQRRIMSDFAPTSYLRNPPHAAHRPLGNPPKLPSMALNSIRGRRILARLILKQKGRCCYCPRFFTLTGPRRATIEHRIAKIDGGSDRVDNLAAACFHCNQHRGKQKLQARQRARARAAGTAAHA